LPMREGTPTCRDSTPTVSATGVLGSAGLPPSGAWATTLPAALASAAHVTGPGVKPAV
jgi:hypothetical protein